MSVAISWYVPGADNPVKVEKTEELRKRTEAHTSKLVMGSSQDMHKDVLIIKNNEKHTVSTLVDVMYVYCEGA